MRPRLLTRLSLRISVPLLMVLPVLVVGISLSLLAHAQHRRAAEDMTAQNLRGIHGQIQAHLDNLLNAPPRITTMNAAMISQGRLPTDNIASWRDTLISELQAFDMLSSIVWGAADGRTTWICRYEGDREHTYYALTDSDAPEMITEYRVLASGAVQPRPSGSFAFDPHIRPWYQAPLAADGPSWCEPFIWVGGGDARTVTLGISYGQPIRDSGGKLLGVIDADLSLNDISRYLGLLRIGRTGGAYVVDHDGKMIGSSTDAALAGPEGARLAAAASSQPRIASSAQAIEQAAGSFAELQDFHRETVHVEGRKLFVLASPYAHATGLRWTIVTILPEDDFLGAVHAARRRSLLWGGVALAGTLLLGVVVAVFMVRPIMALIQHVKRIGEGDLAGELSLSASPEMIQLSQAINRMVADLRDRIRIRQSLALAMEVQQNLLPSQSPDICGLEIAGHSTYCDETGGDYYDFLDVSGLSESTLAVALGDVVGHGVAAAMMMAGARSVLRSHCDHAGSLAELMDHMNTHLCRDQGSGSGRFMTMFLMTLDTTTSRLRWVSAGHDMPFIYDPEKGFISIDGAGVPLGIMDTEQYKEYEFDGVRRGQVYVAGTDGVWETLNGQGDEFGKQRVCSLIERTADQTAQNIADALEMELTAFRSGHAQLDDVTFIVIKVQ